MAQLPFTVLWSPRFGLLVSFPGLFHLDACLCFSWVKVQSPDRLSDEPQDSYWGSTSEPKVLSFQTLELSPQPQGCSPF